MSEKQAEYANRGKTIFRVEKNADNPFVMIDRRPIENPQLSWRAKGILTYLVSRPDNWIVRLGDLIKRSPEGVYAVRSAIKELTAAGHITRREERENGKFKQYVLEVHEIPVISPLIDLSHAVEPQAGNLTLNDTDLNERIHCAEAQSMPIDWVIGHDGKVTEEMLKAEKTHKQIDSANLIATGFGTNTQSAYEIALAFQQERDIVFTESEIKGQRKAIKYLLEKNVKPDHVRAAVKRLMDIKYTVVNLFNVQTVAVDIATQAMRPVEMTRLL